METSLNIYEQPVVREPRAGPVPVAGSIRNCREATAPGNSSSMRITRLHARPRYAEPCRFLSESVWVATSQGSAEYFNSIWETFTGLSKRKFALRWTRAFHPEDLEPFLKLASHLDRI